MAGAAKDYNISVEIFSRALCHIPIEATEMEGMTLRFSK